uniref:Uncharacterized protein n=1 Tax=Oryza rufipogon TaxID=4529 RepID=A0A0E0MVH1_ORYRU
MEVIPNIGREKNIDEDRSNSNSPWPDLIAIGLLLSLLLFLLVYKTLLDAPLMVQFAAVKQKARRLL